ncbi:MAG: NfeD family protein, partial [Arenicellales bacterium]
GNGERRNLFTFGIALLIAGALMVVAEIHSFTIYLLAVAAACFAAGGLAVGLHTGLDVTLAAFGLVLLAGLPAAHVARRRLHNPESDRVSRDDVGAAVRVVSNDDDGLRVSYRGAQWDARPATGLPAEALAPGARLTIVARDGNTLVVTRPDVAATGV